MLARLLISEPVLFRWVLSVCALSNRRPERERRPDKLKQEGQTDRFRDQEYDEVRFHVSSSNAQLTDGGRLDSPEPPKGAAGPAFGAAPGSALANLILCVASPEPWARANPQAR